MNFGKGILESVKSRCTHLSLFDKIMIDMSNEHAINLVETVSSFVFIQHQIGTEKRINCQMSRTVQKSVSCVRFRKLN